MTSSAATPRAGAFRRSGVRTSAAAAVLAFFGTAAMAPFSVANALPGDERAAVFDAAGAQEFTSAFAPEQALFLDRSAVVETGDAAGGSGGSGGSTPSGALYTLQQFIFSGVVNWGGYRFTYYSQQVLPGGGLQIPGRHVNAGGYVSDRDGYIVLAGSAPLGTVFETPFGYPGKIYDRGTVGNHLDVYIR